MSSLASPTLNVAWTLTGQLSEDQPVRSVSVSGSPFTVGRHSRCSLAIPSPTVSGAHAELSISSGELCVRDLDSTNGTFVNGVRVNEETPVRNGDLLQFADVVFRVGMDAGRLDAMTIAGDSSDRALALIQFDKLLSDRAVVPHFQPLIVLDSRETQGYEVLGRSRLFGLATPRAMFSAAAVLNLESELSRLLRIEGIRSGLAIPGDPLLFVNTHPVELSDQAVLEFSLRELRDATPHARIILEIHEAAVTCSRQLRELRSVLADLDMGLAYDDFGAGQARLVELVDARPDYLKFDIDLIRGIDADPDRQRMLASLVKAGRDLGIITLAEGVETEAEHRVCQDIGFEWGQGFLYGRPAKAADWIVKSPAADDSDTHRLHGL